MQRNIILIGMPGSGKSTLGVVLAKVLGMGFSDMDLLIQQRAGRRLQEVLDTDGLDAFLKLEEETLLSVTAENMVLATGGSAILSERAMLHLKTLGTVVYLDVPYKTLERRIKNISTRGIASAPGQSLSDIYNFRTPLYARYADVTVKPKSKSFEHTVEEIIKALSE